MREPPDDVSDEAVLDAVRDHWLGDVDRVAHLPVGFGAHHWRASVAGDARLFVTLDTLGERHSLASLTAAYAGAAGLAAAGLEFVHPPLPPYAVDFGPGALSVTAWLEGEPAGDGEVVDAETDAAMLSRLHAQVPTEIPRWRPLVPVDLAATLAARLRQRWPTGPFGERARAALRERSDEVARWTADYHRLAAEAQDRPWVATHGEPHTRNQMVTPAGTVLVDWESLKRAPRERDLRGLVEAGRADLSAPHWPMIEMFDLEWRLDEISQYAVWFSAPHTGSVNDEVAIQGLEEELSRPEWRRP